MLKELTALSRLALLAILLLACMRGVPAHAAETPFVPVSPLDRLLVKQLTAKGLRPAPLCDDEVFLRRIYLDLIGTIPTAKEAQAFLADRAPRKRAQLIDALMERPEFADYWTLKWCDLLRVKAEFPINLWPNGVQAYARWIHEAMASNMPYDQFACALLTANGSNFRVPPVNFYRAVQGEKPETLASAVALTFMGTRLEGWPEAERRNLAAFFSRVAFKGTAEWKETIVYPDPAQTEPMQVTFPDGRRLRLSGRDDPRRVFTDWLLAPDNPWFAQAIVNRAWFWFFGIGIIHEPDDCRPDNPATHPEVLEHLQEVLVAHDYDLRHLFRVILNSSTYQQSSVIPRITAETDRWFARYPTRRLDAEVLLDALCGISGQPEAYSSHIPEPFTFIPAQNRSIELVDGSITSPFLKMFGRPGRDTGLESERSRAPTREQRLLLINSTQIHKKISKSWQALSTKGTGMGMITHMYLTVLSRYPSAEEKQFAQDYLKSVRAKRGRQDLLWALLNSKEFLYQH